MDQDMVIARLITTDLHVHAASAPPSPRFTASASKTAPAASTPSGSSRPTSATAARHRRPASASGFATPKPGHAVRSPVALSNAQALARQDESINQLRRQLFWSHELAASGLGGSLAASPSASLPASPSLHPLIPPTAAVRSRPVSRTSLEWAPPTANWASPTSTFLEVDDDAPGSGTTTPRTNRRSAHLGGFVHVEGSVTPRPDFVDPVHGHIPSRPVSRSGTPLPSPELYPASTGVPTPGEAFLPLPAATEEYVHVSGSVRASTESTPKMHGLTGSVPVMTRKRVARPVQADQNGVVVGYFDVRRHFLVTLAESLIRFGSPNYRLEYLLKLASETLHVTTSTFALPNMLLIGYESPIDYRTETVFLTVPAGYELWKLYQTNLLCKDLAAKKITIETAIETLEELIDAPSTWSAFAYCIATAGCSMFVAPLAFNGSMVDASVAGLLGVLVGVLDLLSSRFPTFSNIYDIIVSLLVSFLAAGFKLLIEYPLSSANKSVASLKPASSSSSGLCYMGVTLSTLFIILPGLSISMSLVELNSKHVISGTVRLANGLVKTLTQAFGIVLGSRIAVAAAEHWWPESSATVFQDSLFMACSPSQSFASQYGEWLLLPSVVMFAICQGIQLRASPKQFGITTLAVLVAYWSSYVLKFVDIGPEATSALAAFCVGIACNIYSRISHNPGTAPLLAGVLLLVPGGLGVRSSLSLIAAFGSSNAATSPVASSGGLILQMILISLSIALGVLASRIVPPVETQLKTSRIVELRRKVAAKEAARARAAAANQHPPTSSVAGVRARVQAAARWTWQKLRRLVWRGPIKNELPRPEDPIARQHITFDESPSAPASVVGVPPPPMPPTGRARRSPVERFDDDDGDIEVIVDPNDGVKHMRASRSSANVPPSVRSTGGSSGGSSDDEDADDESEQNVPDSSTAQEAIAEHYHQQLRLWLRRWEWAVKSGKRGSAEKAMVKRYLRKWESFADIVPPPRPR
ncbi:hypothetical protein GGF31_004191 [Allomyces arbusculus]|nr:hypothetical protein GGF31_004191 [Allomyces arbusculus]